MFEMESEAGKVAEDLIPHIDDGVIDSFRVIYAIGRNKTEAYKNTGETFHLSTPLNDGDSLKAQISGFVSSVIEKYENGPAEYAYFLLRRHGEPGRGVCSRPVQVGGKGASYLMDQRDQALAKAIAMGPKTLDVALNMANSAVKRLAQVQEAEAESRAVIARYVGQAEAGDETAKYQALNTAVENVGPIIQQMVQLWVKSKGGGSADPSDMTANEALQMLNGLSEAEREAVIKAIMDHVKQNGGGDNVPD